MCDEVTFRLNVSEPWIKFEGTDLVIYSDDVTQETYASDDYYEVAVMFNATTNVFELNQYRTFEVMIKKPCREAIIETVPPDSY